MFYHEIITIGEQEGKDEEGRRFNLATRIMSNGVEVIVAGPTPALRWENSIPQPTLTLSDAVVMMLPQDKPNEFVTKTCTTTFTYLTTITKDGTTIVSTEQQVNNRNNLFLLCMSRFFPVFKPVNFSLTSSAFSFFIQIWFVQLES